MEIGKHIRYYRQQTELSQKEVATLIHMSERSIGHYETGYRIPTLDKLQSIAEALEVEIEDVIGKQKKSTWDWLEIFFKYGGNQQKNMDQRRFRMLMRRAFQLNEEEFTETDDFILTSINYTYPKKLAHSLTSRFQQFCFPELWIKPSNDFCLSFLQNNEIIYIYAEVNSTNELYFSLYSTFSFFNHHPSFQLLFSLVYDWNINYYKPSHIHMNTEAKLYLEKPSYDLFQKMNLTSLDFEYPSLFRNLSAHIPVLTVANFLAQPLEKLKEVFVEEEYLELIRLYQLFQDYQKK